MGLVRVLGAYAPTRDATAERTERKRRWLSEFSTALGASGLTDSGVETVLLGDLNVIEPDHEPSYTTFRWFEYDFYRGLTDKHGLVDAYRHMEPDRSSTAGSAAPATATATTTRTARRSSPPRSRSASTCTSRAPRGCPTTPRCR